MERERQRQRRRDRLRQRQRQRQNEGERQRHERSWSPGPDGWYIVVVGTLCWLVLVKRTSQSFMRSEALITEE